MDLANKKKIFISRSQKINKNKIIYKKILKITAI